MLAIIVGEILLDVTQIVLHEYSPQDSILVEE